MLILLNNEECIWKNLDIRFRYIQIIKICYILRSSKSWTDDRLNDRKSCHYTTLQYNIEKNLTTRKRTSWVKEQIIWQTNHRSVRLFCRRIRMISLFTINKTQLRYESTIKISKIKSSKSLQKTSLLRMWFKTSLTMKILIFIKKYSHFKIWSMFQSDADKKW